MNHANRQRTAKSWRRWCAYLLILLAVVGAAVGWATRPDGTAYDPKTCLEQIPSDIEGLQILQGQRTKESVIRDMVPVFCNAEVLFSMMRTKVRPGRIVFKVSVEYNGEVTEVEIDESTIGSNEFAREVSDFVMDTDFISWARHDENTVFLYPMAFGDSLKR